MFSSRKHRPRVEIRGTFSRTISSGSYIPCTVARGRSHENVRNPPPSRYLPGAPRASPAAARLRGNRVLILIEQIEHSPADAGKLVEIMDDGGLLSIPPMHLKWAERMPTCASATGAQARSLVRDRSRAARDWDPQPQICVVGLSGFEGQRAEKAQFSCKSQISCRAPDNAELEDYQ